VLPGERGSRTAQPVGGAPYLYPLAGQTPLVAGRVEVDGQVDGHVPRGAAQRVADLLGQACRRGVAHIDSGPSVAGRVPGDAGMPHAVPREPFVAGGDEASAEPAPPCARVHREQVPVADQRVTGGHRDRGHAVAAGRGEQRVAPTHRWRHQPGQDRRRVRVVPQRLRDCPDILGPGRGDDLDHDRLMTRVPPHEGAGACGARQVVAGGQSYIVQIQV
jgi:hypothetical protein